jgi:hypothetical protein
MRIGEYSKTVLSLAKTVYRWLNALTDLDMTRRLRIAKYAETVADTLDRTSTALDRYAGRPEDRAARREAMREAARIRGYIETIVEVLRPHLDGRKVAGVKRRLDQLDADKSLLDPDAPVPGLQKRIDRLTAAEGYFRALADGLKA